MGGRSSLPLPGHDPVLRVSPGRLLTALGDGEPTIRPTVPDDLDAIGEIYAHHVRTGVAKHTFHPHLTALGWVWVPTMHIGQGCAVHLRTGELPMGRLIVRTSRHLTAVIDGVIHDTFDSITRRHALRL